MALNGYVDNVASGVQAYITIDTPVWTRPSTWYVGLFTATINSSCDNLSGNEPSGFAYARVQVYGDGATSPYWSTVGAAPSFRVDNAAQIQFPQASGGPWGTITYAVVLRTPSGVTSGDGIFGGPLVTSKPIDDGTTAVFLQNTLAITTTNTP